MSSLMLLPMPAVTRWGHGAGVAGVRAVWRSRWDGRICAPCVIRGASAAKRALPWQDLRAMHSRKAICSAFRIHGAHILPKPARFGYTAAICCQEGALFPSEAPSGMHEARKLPRMAARERTTAKYCHGLPPGNASRRNIAPASHSRTHFAKILPWTNAWIRLAANNDRPPAKQRQRQDPGNAPPPRQKKASALLAFFRCLVLRLEWPRTFAATSHLP